MIFLIKVDGHLIDTRKIERITPIQLTYTGAERKEQAFTIYFHNSSLIIPITQKEYAYNTVYKHSDGEMLILKAKYQRVVATYEEVNGVPEMEIDKPVGTTNEQPKFPIAFCNHPSGKCQCITFDNINHCKNYVE